LHLVVGCNFSNSCLKLRLNSFGYLFNELYFGNIQVGSLAGAAHLLKNNTGVRRWTQGGQKPLIEGKAKSPLDNNFQY